MDLRALVMRAQWHCAASLQSVHPQLELWWKRILGLIVSYLRKMWFRLLRNSACQCTLPVMVYIFNSDTESVAFMDLELGKSLELLSTCIYCLHVSVSVTVLNTSILLGFCACSLTGGASCVSRLSRRGSLHQKLLLLS